MKVVLRIYPDFNKKCAEMSQNSHCFSIQGLGCSLHRSEEQTKNEWELQFSEGGFHTLQYFSVLKTNVKQRFCSEEKMSK